MAGALALGTLMVPSEARTEEEAEVDGPRTAGVLQFAAGFRYGIALDDPAPDPWGVEGGYDLQLSEGVLVRPKAGGWRGHDFPRVRLVRH